MTFRSKILSLIGGSWNFVLAVPVEQKISDGWDRVIMRRAMENILPKEIQLRPTKTSLGLNFHKNLLSFEKPLFEDIIFNQNHLIKDYVDVDFLQEIYENYSSHNGGRALDIFLAVTLAI